MPTAMTMVIIPWYRPRSRGRYQGADHCERARAEAAGTDALQDPEPDQLNHGLGGPAQERPGQEQALAAVEVAQFAPHRGRGGHGECVQADDPGDVGEAAQITDDRRHGRADEVGVEDGEQHREEYA